MNRGARLAIVAGIFIIVAVIATFAAVSSSQNETLRPANNSTNSEPRQITIQLNETMSVEAK